MTITDKSNGFVNNNAYGATYGVELTIHHECRAQRRIIRPIA